MSTSDNNSQLDTSGQKPVSRPQRGASEGRRRLLRGGLLGAPALLALKSAPVLACNCKLPSGFSASGNLSRGGSKNCVDRAPQPSQWVNNYNSGTKKYTGTSVKTTHKLVSDCLLMQGGNITSATTVAGGLVSSFEEVRLISAAFLNVLSGNFPGGLTVTQVRSMWTCIATSGGTYQASSSPSIVWDKTKVLNYLRYVMGLA